MKLTDWWQILDLYETILVWPLALVTAYLTLTGRTRRGRIVGAALLVVWFTPLIHRGIGNVYFDYLCKHEAGEFIYRTVDNVEGILLMRPRDGSKDYFDRMADGDIPEDPWGHTNAEAQYPWSMIGAYRFIESLDLLATDKVRNSRLYHYTMKAQPEPADRVVRFFGYDGRELSSFRKEFADQPSSRFGITWRENRSVWDRLLNLYPGEVSVKDTETGEILAAVRGVFRARPMQACPSGKDDFFVVRFVEKVLRPKEWRHVRGD